MTLNSDGNPGQAIQEAAQSVSAQLVKDLLAPDVAPDDASDAAAQASATDSAARAGAGTDASGDTLAGDGKGVAADGAGDPADSRDISQNKTPAAADPPSGWDKGLQRIQQQVGNLVRDMQAIKTRLDSGQSLTAKQEKQLAQAPEHLERLQQYLADPDAGSPYETLPALAKVVMELHERVASTDSRLQSIDTDISQTQRAGRMEAAAARYPGVDVHSLWQESVDFAAELLGGDEALDELAATLGVEKTTQRLAKIASPEFTRRAQAAAAKLPPKQPNQAHGKAKGSAGSTSVRVGSADPPPAQDRDADDMKRVMALYVPD